MAVSFGGADMGFSFFGIEIGIAIGIDIVDRLLFPNLVASVAVTAEHRVHPVDFILPHNSAISLISIPIPISISISISIIPIGCYYPLLPWNLRPARNCAGDSTGISR